MISPLTARNRYRGKIDMPNKERARNDRMVLRHGQSMKAEFNNLYLKVDSIVSDAVAKNNACCTAGELRAAAHYLARALAEFSLRKRKRIPDAKYDPEDEVCWREDLALKGKWAALTGFPDGSSEQAAIKKILGEPSLEKIERARALRTEAKGSIGWVPPKNGGARYALANAIRHAWLICHYGNDRIRYGRQKDACGEPSGLLHEFIKSVIRAIPIHVSADELHRDVLDIDQALHPAIQPDSKMP